MCGLFGIMGRGILQKDREIFRDLATVSQLRGIDSTGVVAGTYDYDEKKMGRFKIKKTVENASLFFENEGRLPRRSQLLDWIGADVYMGHVRWATKGEITTENAHPFDLSTFLGAHNGTLVQNKYRPKDGRTDSEILFKGIEERGLEEVLSGLWSMDAYALSILWKTKRSLTLTRNSERTLSVAINKERGVIYWASESAMLRFVLNRAKVQYEIFTLLPDKIYDIDIDGIKPGKLLWTVTDVVKKSFSSSSNSRSVWERDWDEYISAYGYGDFEDSKEKKDGKDDKKEGDKDEVPFETDPDWKPPAFLMREEKKGSENSQRKPVKLFGDKGPQKRNGTEEKQDKQDEPDNPTYRCELCGKDGLHADDERCDTAMVGRGAERKFIIACPDCTTLLWGNSTSLGIASQNWDYTMERIGLQ